MKASFLILVILCISIGCWNPVKEKFEFIDKVIQEQIEQSKDSIGEVNAVYEHIPEFKLVRQYTLKMESYIDSFRVEIVEYAANNSSSNDNSKKAQREYSIGNNGDGEAYELERRLNNYVESINEISESFNFDKIAKSANEIDAFNGTEHVGKDFVTISFDQLNLAAVLATLSQLKSEVIEIEIEALDYIINNHYDSRYLRDFIYNREFEITDVRMDSDYPSSDTETGKCEDWSLSSDEIAEILRKSHLINGPEWHQLYSHYPCVAYVEMKMNGEKITAEVNAGSWVTLVLPDTSVWLGDTLPSHESYFLEGVWREID